jgi:hypothetical protein
MSSEHQNASQIAIALFRDRTPVYNWFTEGFDTLDPKEAMALLNELA